jgi:predicted RNA-binding protein with PUA-like domain
MRWLMKTEPEEFSWETLVARGPSCWDGVRNVEARNNLRRMSEGDPVFIYHTGKEKAVVGIGKVVKTAYRDPTSHQAIWSAVDVIAVSKLTRGVTLSELKAAPEFAASPLARKPRLSVMPMTDTEWAKVLELAEQARG